MSDALQAAGALLRLVARFDAEVERFVGSCADCVEHRRDPDRTPPERWEFPTSQWQRLHIDYAGPLFGYCFLVWIDAHTKYAGVHLSNYEDTKTTTRLLSGLYAYFGLLSQIVSNNGPAFVSEKFAKFLQENSILHLCLAPYHPQTNGEAERFVGTFKKAVKCGGPGTREEIETAFATVFVEV